jgi:hypothetical protein
MASTPAQSRSFTNPAGYGGRYLLFNQFDSSLGLLEGLQLSVTASVSGSLQVENLEAGASPVMYETRVQVNAFAPDGTLLGGSFATAISSGTLGGFDGTADFSGVSGAALSGANSGTAVRSVALGAAGSGVPYVGTGLFALPVGDYASNRIDGSANMRVLAEASSSGEVSLGYDYVPSGGGGGSFSGVDLTAGSIFVFNLAQWPVVTATLPSQTFHFGPQTTGWRDSMAVARFDPALGTLSSVQIRLTTSIDASAKAENHGAMPGVMQVAQLAQTTLSREGASLATASARVERMLTIGGSDGVDDFSGAGGTVDGARTAHVAQAVTLRDGATLAAFTGSGTLDLGLRSEGHGMVTGPASFLAEIAALSDATVEVTYSYVVDASRSGMLVDSGAGTEWVPAARFSGFMTELQNQFIRVTPENLNVAATTDNWLIQTGDGNDAIVACGGRNVLDGSGGSNYLTGGSGYDTFFADIRRMDSDVWNIVTNLQAGDDVAVWGLAQEDFSLLWVDGAGAVGATGLTLLAVPGAGPVAALTLAGYTTTDLANGTLSTSFGSSGGIPYLFVRAS